MNVTFLKFLIIREFVDGDERFTFKVKIYRENKYGKENYFINCKMRKNILSKIAT